MRTFDWELMPYFLAVARAGSLRAAAQLIGGNYGTINRGIQALEASYGVRLFHRSKRGFTLTESGEALFPAAEEAELKIIAARKRVEGLDRSETGTIRFSLTPTLAYDVVAPIIARFCDEYPQINIQVRLKSEVESIPNDETDVSLRAAGEITDDVTAHKLFRLNIGTFVSREYLDKIVPKAAAGGDGLTLIGWPEDHETRSWVINSPFPNAKVRNAVADGYMRARLVSLSCGMSPMPVMLQSYFPNLRRMPGTEIFPGPWIWIALHSDLMSTVRVCRFVDYLAEQLRVLNENNSLSHSGNALKQQ